MNIVMYVVASFLAIAEMQVKNVDHVDVVCLQTATDCAQNGELLCCDYSLPSAVVSHLMVWWQHRLSQRHSRASERAWSLPRKVCAAL